MMPPPSLCFLCGSAGFRWVATGYDRMHPRAGNFQYFRCRACGLVSLLPTPKEEQVLDFYPANYAPHRITPWHAREKRINRLAIKYFYGVESANTSSLLRPLFRVFSSRIMKGICEPHGANRLLDVGCGSGDLMEKYRSLGWSVFGIDVSPRACSACRERGLPVHEGTVFDASLQPGSFDIILLSHLIEHVVEPLAVLRRLVPLLTAGGRIVVTTPNIAGLGFLLYRSCWYPLDAPRHLFLFDPHTLNLLARKAGLKVRKLRTLSPPEMLCESLHYASTQGWQLPESPERRREILQRSTRARRPSKALRNLFSPLTCVFSLLGQGDILTAELVVK